MRDRQSIASSWFGERMLASLEVMGELRRNCSRTLQSRRWRTFARSRVEIRVRLPTSGHLIMAGSDSHVRVPEPVARRLVVHAGTTGIVPLDEVVGVRDSPSLDNDGLAG